MSAGTGFKVHGSGNRVKIRGRVNVSGFRLIAEGMSVLNNVKRLDRLDR